MLGEIEPVEVHGEKIDDRRQENPPAEPKQLPGALRIDDEAMPQTGKKEKAADQCHCAGDDAPQNERPNGRGDEGDGDVRNQRDDSDANIEDAETCDLKLLL